MAFRVFFTFFATASKRIELQKPDWTTFEALSQSFQKLSQFLKFYANEYVLLEQQKCVFFIDLSSRTATFYKLGFMKATQRNTVFQGNFGALSVKGRA